MPKAGRHPICQKDELLLHLLLLLPLSPPTTLLHTNLHARLLEANAQVQDLQEGALQQDAGQTTPNPILVLHPEVEG